MLRPLQLRAELETAIAGPHDLHLDGLLMAVHRGVTGLLLRSSRPEQLIRFSELRHPSPRRVRTIRDYEELYGFMGYYVVGEGDHIVPMCTAMEGEWDRGSEHLVKRRDAQDIEASSKRIVRGYGPSRDQLCPVPTREAGVVTWDLLGQRREVMSLARNISSIGGMRAHGYGRVRKWTCEPIEDFSLFAADGRTRRHLPSDVCDSSERIDKGSVEPPYWYPHSFVERVPSGTKADILDDLRC